MPDYTATGRRRPSGPRRCFYERIGFTLIEMLVVISIIALLIGILLPALGMARKHATRYRNNSRVRTVFQAISTYSTSNNEWFPGLNSRGKPIPNSEKTMNSGDGWTVEGRYAILLHEKVLPPESALSPLDPQTVRFPWNPAGTGPNYVWGKHYSFALSSIDHGGLSNRGIPRNLRHEAWRNDGARKTLTVCDRNTGEGSSAVPLDTNRATSVHSDEMWQGATAWNDGHTEFLESHIHVRTRYAGGHDMFDSALNRGTDNIFQEPTRWDVDDALMVHHGWATADATSPDDADGLAEYQPY